MGRADAQTLVSDPAGGPSETLGEGSILGMIGDGVMIGVAVGCPTRPVTL